MSYKGILSSGLSGTVVALILGMVTVPLVAITGGAMTVFIITRRKNIQRHYDAVGTIYYLSLGLLVFVIPFIPTVFKQTPQLFLTVFGLFSAAIVLTKRTITYLLGAIASRLGRGDSASSFWNAVSSIIGTLLLAWSVIKLKYRLIKTGLAGVATPLGLILNIVGRLVELPWVLNVGVDITAMVFIGAVLVGFHTLTSWYEVLALRQDPLVQAFTERSKDTASTAAAKSKSVAETASKRSRDATSKTAQKASDRGEDIAKSDMIGAGVMSHLLDIDEVENRTVS
ncbi:hypothetical protein [Halorubrum ezzemoulense]|uniref:hypothetical protein n=1 Tax=Halorubrum ezzemoulense TaxID=337243 RepID=UPI00232F6637|nr:hypothetical protein [Halorubrum ezzemoulense]MDB2239429.1 hypothetical protein [Halorubrum ezzemoulense]MDB2249796.1 hypothetical protein [Halorubrum ezzemoulense]